MVLETAIEAVTVTGMIEEKRTVMWMCLSILQYVANEESLLEVLQFSSALLYVGSTMAAARSDTRNIMPSFL